MSLINSFFGKKKSNDVCSSRSSQTKNYQYILNNAVAFAGLCGKISKSEDKRCAFPVYYRLRTTDTGLVEVYATHTIHDDDLLDFAYNRAMENDRFGVEYAYNQMIDKYKLTSTELRSFQDVSDFMDFLRGGISGYNSCKRSGSDIEITQELGCVQSYEKNVILSEIKRSVLNSYSDVRAKTYGSTAVEISF